MREKEVKDVPHSLITGMCKIDRHNQNTNKVT